VERKLQDRRKRCFTFERERVCFVRKFFILQPLVLLFRELKRIIE